MMQAVPVVVLSILVFASLSLVVAGGFYLRAAVVARHNRLGLDLARYEMWDMAAERFGRALAIDRGHALSHYNLGFVLYHGKGLVDKAHDEFEIALSLDREFAAAHYALGHLLLHCKGNVAKAREHLGAASRLDPRLAEAYNTLGLAAIRDQDWKGAAGMFRKACEINPRYESACCNLAVASVYLGHNAEAVRCARVHVELAPQSAVAYNNLANIAGAAGRRDEAIEALRKSIAIDGGNWQPHFWMGCLHLQSGRPSPAVVSFHDALRLHDRHGLTHYNLALCYEALGMRAEARRHIDMAVELNPALGEGLI